MHREVLLSVVLSMTLLVCPATAAPEQPARSATPRGAFVTVNGVRLHYVDWGGTGEPLLFLTPLGGDLLEQFAELAPRFTDRFRVLGLTRRGQAPSEAPATGYDVDTLVGDLVGFLDAMGIRRVNLAGHSIAGSEMTRFAGRHQDRVSRLIYLDAAVDYTFLAEIAEEAGLEGPRDPALAAIMSAARLARPDYTKVAAPALNVKVVFDGPIPIHPQDDNPAYRRYLQLAVERGVVDHNIEQFRRDMKRGTILTLRNTTHGGFLTDPAQLAIVVPAMREFLLGHGTPPSAALSPSESSAPGFTAHTIASGLSGGYQVVVADLNRDNKPDVIAVASGLTELRWYENPGWEPHVLVAGISQPINAAAYDVDGDGIPEIALAHGFSNVYANSPGIVSILTHQGDPAQPWSITEIDRVPTSHRLRFADVEGTGRKVLVNFPLIGPRALAPEYRDRVSLVLYRPGEWKREVITDSEEGVVHGILSTAWDDDRRESLLSASFRGVHVLQFDKGLWKRSLVGRGDPADWPKSGSSDVIVGHLGRERFVAAIEPWHGNKVAVYRQQKGAWMRRVIDETIADGHTIVAGDFDGDGQDEILVGERQGKRSVYLYRATSTREDSWSKQSLDDGGMAAAGCAVADLNADRRPDIVCIGTATANLKWYENRSRAAQAAVARER